MVSCKRVCSVTVKGVQCSFTTMTADFDPGTGLGPRLRKVREELGLSARELARRIGCSASLVSQIERGVSVPSVGVLYSIGTELGCSLDYLLFGVRAGRPADDPGPVQRAGCRQVIDLASGVRWERLTPGADPAVDFLEVVYSPGGHSTDERRPLRHEGREYGVIVSGTLTVNVGFDSYELAPGDSIAFDSTIPHEYLNNTPHEVHAIWAVTRPV
jgi:transcriptional regulator with XRE-family HTH domain